MPLPSGAHQALGHPDRLHGRRAFALLARYLDLAIGERALSDPSEVDLPLEVPELLRDDVELRRGVQAGEFDRLLGSEASIRQWINKVFRSGG